MKYWSPSHLNLLLGQDRVAPLHPLIFPGFPFMKTGVLSGKVDIYKVLAVVWIWDRLRVQTWPGQCGSFPGLVHAPSSWAGRDTQCAWQKLTFLAAWCEWYRRSGSCGWPTAQVVVGVWKIQESTTELLLSGHTNTKDTGIGREEGRQAWIKIPDLLRETRWGLRQWRYRGT